MTAVEVREADRRDRLVDVTKLADDTGIPVMVWETLAALRVGPRAITLAGRRVWTLDSVDAWRNDLGCRREDEKRAVSRVLDVFAEGRREWEGC